MSAGVGDSPDFTPIMSTLVFNASSLNGQQACVQFNILEDEEPEQSEEFSVHFSIEAGASSAMAFDVYTVVHILDNDRKFYCVLTNC